MCFWVVSVFAKKKKKGKNKKLQEEKKGEENTLPSLILRELSSDIVELGPLPQLLHRFFFFPVFLTLFLPPPPGGFI